MPAFIAGWVALAILLLASRSRAATLELSVTVLTYTAATGAANALTVSLSAGNYTIDDPGEAAISIGVAAAGAGCVALDANTVRCPRSAIASWDVSLGDQSDSANLSAVLEPTTIRGGTGNDTLIGGAGPDTFTWNPGDASDTLDGGPGVDALTFSGANINERFAISALPGGFQLTRDVASVVMSATNIEALSLQTLGGDDTITTVPLPATSQTIDGGAQNATDTLSYDAGGACTTETGSSLQSLGGQVVVFTNFEAVNLLNQCTTFPATVDISDGVLTYTAGTGATNALTVSRSFGSYTIDDTGEPAITLGAGAVGAGCVNIDANTATCPKSAVVLWNVQLGDHDDTANLSAITEPTTIRGGTGNDTLVGGAGPDTFTWFPGDASDVLDGGAGLDTLAFSGAAINEHFGINALPGNSFQLTRDVANIAMTVSNVEALNLQALGGDDTVATHPLPSTSQVIDGGPQNVIDTLNYDAGGACTTQTPGAFQSAGARPVTFTGFESVALVNPCAMAVPALGHTGRLLLLALFGVLAWLGARRIAGRPGGLG
jgi:Ca2+-binding RTX toxin-like protein